MRTAKDNDTKRLQAWKDRMKVRRVAETRGRLKYLKLLQARDRNERGTQVSIVVKFKDASRNFPSLNFSDLTSQSFLRSCKIVRTHVVCLVSVPSTTSLDVILWEIVSHMEPGMRDRVRSSSHFETGSPREVLQLSDPASKVGKRILQLTLDA